MNEHREILSTYIVVCDRGVISVTTDKQKAETVYNKTQSIIPCKIKKIETHIERIEVLSNTCKVSNISDPLNFRNKVILEWHNLNDLVEEKAGRVNLDKTWDKIKQKYNIDLDIEQFSQAMFDIKQLCF